MSRIVQFMRDLVAKGMSWEDAAAFAERFEDTLETAVNQAVTLARPVRSSGAERQARLRAKREAEKAGNVTSDVTSDVTSLSEGSQGSLPPEPPNLPNPPNLSQVPPIVPQKSARKAKLGPAKGAFAKFWSEYPLKVGKLDAEKAYAKAWAEVLKDDPDADPEAQIFDGLMRGRPLFEPEFIPHPSTWLNKGRWMDVPQPDLPDSTGPPKFSLTEHDDWRRRMAQQLGEDAA